MHVRIVAEVRIDVREIRDPIAVIAGGLMPWRSLHRLVLIDGAQPDRRGTQSLDIVQPGGQAFEVSAVIEGFGGRIESRNEPSTLKSAPVILRIAIFESIGQEEVN